MADAYAYEPTLRDELAALLLKNAPRHGMRERLVRGIIGSGGAGNTGGALPLVDFTPLGIPLAAQEAGREIGRGAKNKNALEAAGGLTAAALTMLPGGKAAAKGAKAAEKKLAEKTAKKVRGIVNTPDLRTVSPDLAVKIAREEPHIMRDASGQVIGAPRGVKSASDIEAMRAAFDRDVEAGAPGGDWYTRARATNREWAGSDPARQRLLAQEEALWSAQASPDTNLNFALQGHNAYEMGVPLAKVRTGAQAFTYNKARDLGVEIPLGKKTGVYGQHLDPTMEHGTTGTNDIWHARGFGYKNADNSAFSRALTPQEHRFLDYETVLATDRANQNKLAGRGNWQAHEVQAAPWVAGKGRGLAKQRNLSEAEGIAEASKTYPDYANKYSVFATHEQTPGVMTGHLPGLVDSDLAVRRAYAADPRSSWTDAEGRDAIYDALGFYQRPTLEATGVYTPPGGVLEINPARVARPLVGVKAGGAGVDDASRQGLTAAESLRAYIDAQGAGAWHKPILNAKPGAMGSVFVPNEGPMKYDTILALKELGRKHGLGDIIDSGQGVSLTSFADNAPTGAQTRAALKGSLGRGIRDILPSAGAPSRTFLDTGYAPMFEVATRPGSGEVTQELLRTFEALPARARKNLQESLAVRAKARGNLERDAELAVKLKQPVREDIQRARKLLAEGGIEALKAAVKRGEVLPATAGALLGGKALAERQPSDQGA